MNARFIGSTAPFSTGCDVVLASDSQFVSTCCWTVDGHSHSIAKSSLYCVPNFNVLGSNLNISQSNRSLGAGISGLATERTLSLSGLAPNDRCERDPSVSWSNETEISVKQCDQRSFTPDVHRCVHFRCSLPVNIGSGTV